MNGGSAASFAARFDAFAARKVRAAVEARFVPLVSDIDHGPASFEAIANDWSRHLFDGPFYLSTARDSLPSTSLVFVQSADGNTVADDPGALGGGDTDKHLVYEGLSRVAADAVLAGAETIRGGDVVFSVWHPEMVALRRDLGLPRHPTQIIATLRGLNFSDALLLNLPDVPVVIVTVGMVKEQIVPAVAERPWIRVVTLRAPADLRPAFTELRAGGMRRISAVGGRTVAAALLDAGLIDDLYLTTSPRSGGRPGTPLYTRPLSRELIVRKHGTAQDAGVVFEHFRIRPQAHDNVSR